jgi:hypothetical protein
MIPCFPKLYDDELFASGCSRFRDRVNYASHKEVVAELFATTNATAVFDLPSHLGAFVSALPPKHPCTVDGVEGIIYGHTLWPFFEPFLPVERARAIVSDMIGDKPPSIHMQAGIMAGGIAMPPFLQYCDLCVVADSESEDVGEPYWHRSHQLSGVDFCPEHLRPLVQSSVPTQNRKTRHQFLSADETLGNQKGGLQVPVSLVARKHQSKLTRLALDAGWLLARRGLGQGLSTIHDKYNGLLKDCGLANSNGRVRMAELQEAFTTFYPDDLLAHLDCALEQSVGENWLHRIVRKPTEAQHPLRHLLLMQFIGCTSEEFFSLTESKQPFGEAPWPCLNRAAAHYLQPVITQCIVSHNRDIKAPMGTFTCECGFVYTRNGPDTEPQDRFVLARVTQFGPEWEQALAQMWRDPAMGLRATARALGVDPVTVKRYGAKNAGPNTNEIRSTPAPALASGECDSEDPAFIRVRDKERACWLRAINDNPGSGTNALRAQNQRLYTWLYRHDREWLHVNMPPRPYVDNTYERVNWPERDRMLAQDVVDAGKRIRLYPGRPHHISTAAVGREMGQLALIQQHLDKLPLTREVLGEVTETREQYAIRRISWAGDEFMAQHRVPSKWDMIKRAGVERLLDKPEIVAHILDVIHKLRASMAGLDAIEGDRYRYAG